MSLSIVPPPPDPPPDVPVSGFERAIDTFLGWWRAAIIGVVKFLLMPFIILVPMLRSVFSNFLLSDKWKKRFDAWEDGLASWLKRRRDDLWGLKDYGDWNLTPRVQDDIGRNNLIMTGLAPLVAFAWLSLWQYTGVHWFWAIFMLPWPFIVTELWLERGIFKMYDPGGRRRWMTMVGRLAVLLLASNLTAIPVELVIFKDPIDERIESRETVRIDTIRQGAIAQEEALVDKQKAVTSAVLSTSAESDTVRRAAELEMLRGERASIIQRLDVASLQLVEEMSNGRGSVRGAGDGPSARALREQKAGIEAERDAIDERIAAFISGSTELSGKNVEKNLQEQARLATKLDEKRNEIKAMTPDELVAAYGGTYREPDGFLTRYGILIEIVSASYTSHVIFWGCKLLMVVLQLGVLFFKYGLSSKDTKDYYSPYAQALGGHPGCIGKMLIWAPSGDEEAKRVVCMMALNGHAEALKVCKILAHHDDDAQTVLMRLGYDSKAAVIVSDEVAQMRERLLRERQLLDAAQIRLARFAERLYEGSNSASGPRLSREQKDDLVIGQWQDMVVPQLQRVAAEESVMVDRGMAIPEWPDSCAQGDPRQQKMVWDMTDIELNQWLGRSVPVLVATG